MALGDYYEFFRNTISDIGLDISVLVPTIFVGIVLAIIFNGTTPPDSQTTNFALIFGALAFAALFASWISRITHWDFFIGIDHAIDERLSVKEHPYLLLIYLLVFGVIGFALVTGYGSFIAPFSRGNASSVFAAPNFIFQNLFSPICEEFFFRGLLQPLLYFLLIPVFMWILENRMDDPELTAKIAAFAMAAMIQGSIFAFVHIAAFNGDPTTLASSVAFGFLMAGVSGIFGLGASIAWHMGNNLGATFENSRQVPVPTITSGG